MKKIIVLFTMVITVLILAAFSIGFTYAFFTDMDTTSGAKVTSEYLEVSVELVLAGYGIPSDILLTSSSEEGMPDKSTVTVTNEGSIDMNYTLILTVDKETVKLLDTNGLELIGADDLPIRFTGSSTDDVTGNEIYVYESPNVLQKDESEAFGLALTFKGKALIDGNDFQNKLISIMPAVEAVQVGGAE